ncbi:MAG: aminotransferase class III-fold pyridoxal phosphate-dependent enzyme [Steroidobacteraceae bacterium]
MNNSASQGLTLRERDASVIADIARLRFSPVCLVGGHGNRLIEEGGRQLLDFGASFGPAILGHSHPAIIEAVTAAVSRMAGASLSAYPNENGVALAEELLRITPGKTEGSSQARVLFDLRSYSMVVEELAGIAPEARRGTITTADVFPPHRTPQREPLPGSCVTLRNSDTENASFLCICLHDAA